ncbi:hypothetical protein G9G63_09375 [Paenibacillus sp. EKM202P]|uniref:hypothetical protein n=1 Tax=unclassified Paenibacillus TaxID=185978 RepID=UPI0013ECE466|nr:MULTISPECIES: hypothetical protein [unclassified Paenibacillus]KAF6565359.1 hypothetical protein G9G63_09375 [Paenibacillus sp. EKM202P]KAF6569316.1 hypothetical protein G9G64_12720 [Paenibacillus sp. EKM207P]
MKVNYKGFKLQATREKSLGGWSTLYYTIYTPTGFEFISSFEDSEETVREKIKQLKEIVNDYLLNPQDYDDEQM